MIRDKFTREELVQHADFHMRSRQQIDDFEIVTRAVFYYSLYNSNLDRRVDTRGERFSTDYWKAKYGVTLGVVISFNSEWKSKEKVFYIKKRYKKEWNLKKESKNT